MEQGSFSRLLVPSLLAGAVLALRPEPAAACGGFFCSQQQPVNQAAERIIFADNGDGTITAVIQIMYEGPSESFSWLLPISTVPEGDQLGVASDVAFTRLQLATNPQYNLNVSVEGSCREENPLLAGGVAVTPERETCADNPLLAGCDLPEQDINGAPVNVEASGVVGAFEWTVISVDPAQADPVAPALEWLTTNGYDVPPEGAGLLGPYLAEGMYLLALRLTKGSDAGSIRPIRLTYAAEAPMIPIKLTAVAANQDMGVMTWALSSARAVPFNYHALELNEARINWFNASSNYNDVVIEAADAAGGQGFVTEFAGPSSQLADVVWQPWEEDEWRSIRSRTYSGFQEMFDVLYGTYQGWSGFWDAVRRSVTPPEGVSFDDLRLCPSCYSEGVTFSPSALLDAIESDVIEPVRSVQALIDRAPYTTRLYSTLSAAEMTVDPVFVTNPDLPELNNVHTANQIIECDEGVWQSEAPWRIELPQGSVLRGTPDTAGQWPEASADQPPNLRVLALAASGDGAVVEDNSELINALLADYNAGVPSPTGSSATSSDGSPIVIRSGGGFCNLTAGPRRGSPALLASLGALLAAGVLRRKTAVRHRTR